jgi:hypothetical protein
MSAPPRWRYRCYVSENGTDEIRAWYESQSLDVQGKFLSRLRALRELPLPEWRCPLFRWLRGDAHGLGEMRFKADRIQQRPLGFHGPGVDVFTLVFPAREKSGRFLPRNATDLALGRKTEVERDVNARSRPCWLFDNTEPDVSSGVGGRRAPRWFRCRLREDAPCPFDPCAS